jgi:menaquinone-dependent protoporphyrinogen oxidase
MTRRLLIAYASRTGTTAEVAQALASALRAQGLAVDASPAARVAALDDYDAVLVGSAARFGTWLDEALAFLRRHRAALATRPVAFFTLHMQAAEASEAGRARRAAYTAAAHALATPRTEAFFLGALLPERLSFVDRIAVKLVGAPLKDLRDWPAIDAWAQSLPAQLLSGPGAGAGRRS